MSRPTGCMSFASETSCEDSPLWAIASRLPLCAECGSLAELARFLRLLKETEHSRHWRQEEVERGRTASYPTAPAQIPACGFPAPGSSSILASAARLRALVRYSQQ